MSVIDFEAGKVIAIDKPYGWTSFNVTSFVKYRVWEYCSNRKLKVGHAGTLDPLATGLVLVCTGKMTKKIEEIQAGEKTYQASILLGARSASYDLETPVITANFACVPSLEQVTQSLKELTGDLQQMPPMFSAKKVGGKRAYEAARKNETVDLKPTSVTVYSIDINHFAFPYLEVTITCSKGTYIRSVASDLGELLGCGGVLTALRRTKSGDFGINEAYSPSTFLDFIKENS